MPSPRRRVTHCCRGRDRGQPSGETGPRQAILPSHRAARGDQHRRERRRADCRRAPGLNGPSSPGDEPRAGGCPAHLLGSADTQLPALLHRPVHLAGGDVDAVGGPGVAGVHPHPLRHRARLHHRRADAAGSVARPVRRRDRRPRQQAPAHGGAADGHGRAGARPRRADDHGRRTLLGGLCSCGHPRPEQHVREPIPAVLRARDGGTGPTPQRGEPQLDDGECRPRHRAGRRRRADRHGRRRGSAS